MMSNQMSSQDRSNQNISSSKTIEKEVASGGMQNDNDHMGSNERMNFSDSQDKINNKDIKSQISELSINNNTTAVNSQAFNRLVIQL